ncbi:response regulator [Gloeocapsopsis dulcis]|uniref:response regulator n=1 Tax=Gloeocapsopsis dulcis TaxID=2859516 RepID=UPI002B25A15C|nr:response regulator [Gloeocapsopsis dulcis]WNN88471.1 response regulator [Gloeocapsopsis dulcis]
MSSYQESSTDDAGDVIPSSTTRTKILIVEDNDLNRQMLDDYLSFCGYEILSLADGTCFFQKMAEFQPQLVLLDLKLPDIDGYSLLEKIQQRNDWRHLPIFVVSAFAFSADQQRALRLGAKRYFVKPVNLTELKQAISKELSAFNQ